MINASLTTTIQPTTSSTKQTTSMPKPPLRYSCNKTAPCGCGESNVIISPSRIVGGEDAVPHSWPMIVSIRMGEFEHTCGGTILSELFILTAAHCVVEKVIPTNLFRNVEVAVGLHNRSASSATIRRVKRFHVHPNYNKETLVGENDIAILELAQPLEIGLKFRTTRTCLPHGNSSIQLSQYPPNNTRLMVVGWGALKFMESKLPTILQQAQIFLIDNDYPTCKKIMTNGQSQLCAALYEGGKSECDALMIVIDTYIDTHFSHVFQVHARVCYAGQCTYD